LSAVCSRSESELLVIFPTTTPSRPGITNPTSAMPKNVQVHIPVDNALRFLHPAVIFFAFAAQNCIVDFKRCFVFT